MIHGVANINVNNVKPNTDVNVNINPASANDGDFEKIFQKSLDIQFSKHASGRLSLRDISLSSEQIKRVEGAISKAGEKGIKDSLILVDNVALVVNVRNKIVVTAMNKDSKNIFTNIDGAVIA